LAVAEDLRPPTKPGPIVEGWWERFKFWFGREITGSRCGCGGTWRYLGNWQKSGKPVIQCDGCDRMKYEEEG
jgi:hypothetical protein